MTEPTEETLKRSTPGAAAVLAEVIHKLPPLPGTIHELLALDVKDPTLPENVRAIVARDPALAARVVKIANSAAFRGQGEVSALGAAIHRIGAPLVVGNALQTAVHKIFDPYGGMGRRLGEIAVLEANLMAALATCWKPRLGFSSEVAYTHGLLHDIGHLVMALKFGKELEAFGHRGIPAGEVAQREIDTFGFDHQTAGKLLANHWELPDEVTLVIAMHHYPRELREGLQERANALIDMLAITDRLSRLIVQHVDQRTKAEAAITEWLVKPETQKVLSPVAAMPDDVLTAVPLALAGLERDRILAESGGERPTP